ncbi:nucleolar MIF4G domain-containing protein 1-like [Diaphorina citri]|uniref:Nucleolar MIF4G domain-containing protein 1-like n=1 Tax=Diaphorina citri TaxID=121845 RepID=A0A3Q0J1E4_DIACI|nr:nucleolar MIF4G domain-containing protein 1-like [Diaphorina citri]
MKFKKKFNTNENKIKTRKELRKEKRQEKKQKKNEYFSNRKQSKLQKDSLNKENNENRKQKLQQDIVVNKSENKKQTVKGKTQKGDAKSKNKENEESTLSMLEKQRIREKQAQKSIEANSKAARNKQLLNANREEEKEIRRLEKQLNMNKRKTKKIPSSFVSDGLDYLLELCDSDKRKELSEFESQQAFSDAESDFESDLAQVTGKKSSKGKITKRNKDSEDNSDDDQEDDFSGDKEDFSGDEEDFSGDEDEMSGAAEFSGNEGSDNEDSENESVSENQNDGQDEWEDDSIHESDFDDSDDGFGLEDNSEDESEEEFDNDEQVDSEEGSFDEELEGDEQYDSDDQDSDDKRDSHSKENAKKRKLDAANDCSKSGKKVKFADKVDANEGGKVLSKEERMKHLMGFVEKESKGKLGKGKKEKPEKEEKLSKEERMKKLIGFVEKESQGKPGKEKTLSREDRMKQLLGFVNSEEGKEGESGGEGGGSGEDDGTWEDIYGRLRENWGKRVFCQTKATRYIPPHLRAAQSSNSESLVLLKRQLKGLLNRLTENNIKSIGSNVEQLYTQHSRHDMNETLLGLMRESLLSETLSPEKMMMEHVMLVTVLHANVGEVIEFTELGKPQVHLVRQIFLSLLLLRDEETLRSVFGKIAKAPELLGLREGLHLFLVTFVLKRLDGDVGSEGERMKRNAGLVQEMLAPRYLDAYEKLLKLGVRTEQSDDIVNVIVHCLLNEKQYNPYYTHLTQHFISSNRRYRMLVQYSVWDKFKLLGEMRPTQIVNLAKFLSALFIQHALPLSILKVSISCTG